MSATLDANLWTKILGDIKNIAKFDEQMNYLESSFQNNTLNISDLIKTIQNDLTLALSQTFPQHRIHFYGSAIMNLNIGPPVLDIYVENILEHVKYELDIIITVRSLLLKSKNFTNVVVDSKSNFTFLKWKHKNVLDCVLKVYPSKVWVATSELIHGYLNLDKKLRHMFLLFKTLGRFIADWKSFPSVAIYWLVIFYLQQKPYCLPPVYQVEKQTGNNLTSTFIFQNVTSETLSKATIEDLFVGFLKFYSNFDYVRYVVAPYCGSVIEKICFVKPYDLPDCYINFMKTGKDLNVGQSYCIQDPFQHSQNLVANMEIVSGNFRNLCEDAVKIIKQTAQPNLHTFYLVPQNSIFNFCLKKESTNFTNQEWFDLVKMTSLRILDFLICHKIIESSMKTTSATFECLGRNLIFEDDQNILKGFLPKVSEDLEGGISVVLNVKKPRNRGRPWTFRINLLFNESEANFSFEALKGIREKLAHAFYFFQTCLIRLVDIEVKKLENKRNRENNTNSEICTSLVPDKTNEIETDKPQSSAPNDSVTENVDSGNSLENEGNVVIKPEDLNDASSKVPAEEIPEKDEVEQENEKNPDESEEKQTEDVEEGEISEHEEEDDDVPADFFDDFSKEDFLSGLDIVDTWDQTGKAKKKQHRKSKGESKTKNKVKKRSRSKSKGRKRSKGKSKEGSVSRHRSKELSPSRQRSKERIPSRYRSKERSLSKHRSESRSRERYRPSRQRSKERSLSRHRSRERNFSRPGSKERSLSKHRSKSRSTERYRPKIKSRRRERSISKSKSRSRSRTPRPTIRRRRSVSRSRSRSRSHDRRNNRRRRSYSSSSVSSYEKYKDRRSRSPKRTKLVDKEALMEEIRAKLNGTMTSNTVPPSIAVPPPPLMSLNVSYSTAIWNSATDIQGEKLQASTSSREKEEEKKRLYLAKKLFMEKKMTLSDYLTIIAKREGVLKQHPQKLEKISLCYDVLKIMGYCSAPLKVVPRSNPHNSRSQKFSSPLEKSHPEISFTSTLQHKNKGFFKCILREILERVGLLSKEKDIQKLITSVADAFISGKPVTKETAANILKISLTDLTEKNYKPTPPTFSDVGTQCKERTNVGVQATRDECSFTEESGTRTSRR